LAINILSLGTPMLLMGDEVRRTQYGNNNAYGQDNEINWFDWSAVPREADLRRFVRGLIAIRAMRDSVRIDNELTLNELIQAADVQIHGVHLGRPDLSHQSHSLAVTARSLSGLILMHFVLNAYCEALDFELPTLPLGAVGPERGWRRAIDTSQAAPHDLVAPPDAPLVVGSTHSVAARSVVMFVTHLGVAGGSSWG
jgi:glycogen operon protein